MIYLLFFFIFILPYRLDFTVANYNPRDLLDHDQDTTSEFQSFSGIYIPSSIRTEIFGGALLMHRDRFMLDKTIKGLRTIIKRGIEQALLSVLFHGPNVMTRDYFDFQVNMALET